MRVKDLMTEKPFFCTPENDLQEIARIMAEHDCGVIPVIENRESLKPVGVITDRDIVCRSLAKGKDPMDLKVRDCMSTPVVTCSPNAGADECCKLMEENQVRRVVVVDDQGRCCGIVSQADIAEKASSRKTAEVLKDVSRPTPNASRVMYH